MGGLMEDIHSSDQHLSKHLIMNLNWQWIGMDWRIPFRNFRFAMSDWYFARTFCVLFVSFLFSLSLSFSFFPCVCLFFVLFLFHTSFLSLLLLYCDLLHRWFRNFPTDSRRYRTKRIKCQWKQPAILRRCGRTGSIFKNFVVYWNFKEKTKTKNSPAKWKLGV